MRFTETYFNKVDLNIGELNICFTVEGFIKCPTISMALFRVQLDECDQRIMSYCRQNGTNIVRIVLVWGQHCGTVG